MTGHGCTKCANPKSQPLPLEQASTAEVLTMAKVSGQTCVHCLHPMQADSSTKTPLLSPTYHRSHYLHQAYALAVKQLVPETNAAMQ